MAPHAQVNSWIIHYLFTIFCCYWEMLLGFQMSFFWCLNSKVCISFIAYCNNTVGSYNCTCYPEYTGNGTSCTGNFMYDTSPKHILLLRSSQCPLSVPQMLESAPLTCLLVLSFSPSLCLSVCLSVWLSVRPSVRLSVCLSVCLFVCLSVRPSVSCVICFEHFPLAPVTWNNIWSG